MPRKPQPGTVVQIPLPDGRYAYGRVYRDASVCFYRQASTEPAKPPIGSRDFAFCVGVYDDVLRRWDRVGTDPFGPDEDEGWPPPTSIQDPISGSWSIYKHGVITPAEPAVAEALETTAAWDDHHLLPRLVSSLSDA